MLKKMPTMHYSQKVIEDYGRRAQWMSYTSFSEIDKIALFLSQRA